MKTLMPEVLPAPRREPVIPNAVRARVKRHMQQLFIGAAGLTLANCSCLAVDPLPPPARCRTTGNVLDSLRGAVSTFTTDAGAEGVTLSLDDEVGFSSGGVVIEELVSVTGGQLLAFTPQMGSGAADVSFTPGASGPVVVKFKASCGGAAQTFTATLTRADAGTGWSVVIASAP